MAGENPEYTSWLREKQCAAPGANCMARSEPHHPRHDVGMGKRAHDERAIPICHLHHMDLHGLSGPFKDWDRSMVRVFCDTIGEHYLALYRKLEEGVFPR